MSFPESLVPITGEEPSLNTPALVAGEKELQSPPMPACQARVITTAGGLLRPGNISFPTASPLR